MNKECSFSSRVRKGKRQRVWGTGKGGGGKVYWSSLKDHSGICFQALKDTEEDVRFRELYRSKFYFEKKLFQI